ncbi:MAG: amidohydrolase family protein [SAR202 cluster bacterium]|jgi:aminocarboxymuconate-semialdehyde decarboxylase|nr:amidohydrolase family protein [SAR202 cluster bacterium]MDP6713816.1 amidohydrolase family protein [SAR202 cluster bacterium]
MPVIDIHAHLTPERFRRGVQSSGVWHGMTSEEGELGNPRNSWSVAQRIEEMDSLGIDIQVVSSVDAFYRYEDDLSTAIAIAQDCNDEIAGMTRDHPSRFMGLCNLPMQDVSASIDELERGVTELGLKGAMINDHVNGKTYDAPEFRPFWLAAERLGALIFIHQGDPTLVSARSDRYHLFNTIGNLVDRTVTFASLVFGGVIDRFPELKICLAHGGGYACFGIGRMDRGWQVRPEARVHLQTPPSEYLRRFYYDTVTHDDSALRMLIDNVGAERILFGTDWPADMRIENPVPWLSSLDFLTSDEKEMILGGNLERTLRP